MTTVTSDCLDGSSSWWSRGQIRLPWRRHVTSQPPRQNRALPSGPSHFTVRKPESPTRPGPTCPIKGPPQWRREGLLCSQPILSLPVCRHTRWEGLGPRMGMATGTSMDSAGTPGQVSSSATPNPCTMRTALATSQGRHEDHVSQHKRESRAGPTSTAGTGTRRHHGHASSRASTASAASVCPPDFRGLGPRPPGCGCPAKSSRHEPCCPHSPGTRDSVDSRLTRQVAQTNAEGPRVSLLWLSWFPRGKGSHFGLSSSPQGQTWSSSLP